MPASAPRLDSRLLTKLEELERRDLSFAEIRRGLVTRSRELEIPPPSYEHVRRLAWRLRIERESTAEIRALALGVATGARHPWYLLAALKSAELRGGTL